MFISEATPRADLEDAILSDKALYYSFNEERLLNGEYTTEELRDAVIAWIEQGDECAAA